MANRSMFVGMAVHKESIDISLAEEGRNGEVRHDGGIAGDLEALAKVVKALRAPTRRWRFVYEAGPCYGGALAARIRKCEGGAADGVNHNRSPFSGRRRGAAPVSAQPSTTLRGGFGRPSCLE